MRSMWTSWLRNRPRTVRRAERGPIFTPHLEQLGDRIVPAVTATFTAATGTLAVTGDNLDNNITISRDAAGQILVNGGAVAVAGGTPTVANTNMIQVFGLGGNDTITLNEANGALPQADLSGGDGNDVLTGGSGNDQLFGEAGNDTLLGKGGQDTLNGADGNDTLTGGDGDDRVFGDAGDDRMIWNPGDDTDLNEGGAGTDTTEVNGGNGAEQFTATPNGTRVRFDRVNPAPFSIDIGTTENLVVNMNGGDDTFTGSNGLAPLIALTVDGGAGNDTVTGGDGADFLLGGDGNDTITGGRGNDTALMGAGDDTFVWNPGDGSDTVEGQDGTDTMLFNGANVNENIAVSANGGRVRFTRDVANIVMDLNDVEGITFNALGGADTITVNDLSGTDARNIQVNLAAAGGAAGDGAADTIVVNGTNGNDAITVSGTGPNAQVVGLTAKVTITGAEPANDLLRVQALGGDDVIEASQLIAPAIQFVADGGTGNNVIVPPGGPLPPPIAKADNVSVTEDSRGTVLNVLANDTAIGTAITVVSVTGAAHGTASISADGKSIVYTPRVNFVGTDTFTYTISNGFGGTATATVTVAVLDRPDGAFALGAGPGGPALAFLFDAATGRPRVAVDAFPGFRGGVSVATGDVNGDGTPDLIAAAGPGGNAQINVYDGTTGNLVLTFLAFPGFQGGVNVAAGDLNGDGLAEIIAATASGLGVVEAFSGRDLTPLAAFLPFGAIPIGLTVASGDVSGDGRDDVIVGTASAVAAVGVFSGRDLTPLAVFLPFGPVPLGVNVAAGDVNGDGFADVIAGTASGLGVGGVYSGRDLAPLSVFLPLGPVPVGATVASEDVNGDGRADVLTGTASGLAVLETFNGRDSALVGVALPFGTDAVGGVFVG